MAGELVTAEANLWRCWLSTILVIQIPIHSARKLTGRHHSPCYPSDGQKSNNHYRCSRLRVLLLGCSTLS